ncbi:hypothetical protein RIF29_13595 [Crotalaria pallida]|uniref:non-specific serine/threonine protein kinase n=1 Tax=Crotalaria pallida TaxID=3830 RepID=A0AAN9P2A6_CROPI
MLSSSVSFDKSDLILDLKAENLLLGSDGLWKLCDFGSTSTNHKRFEKLEEMGIEEDNIRKHTTPAYRAPEIWDLFLREVINEKVDIWALGCLLFRICYFKSAFDGESKLQVLNGNYRIPDLPKYTSSVMGLIRDMLQAKPDDRPDITQASALLDWPFISMNLGASMSANKSPPMPRRNSPIRASGEPKYASHPSRSSTGGGNGGQRGAFWSTHGAKDSLAPEEKRKPVFDELSSHHISSKHNKTPPGDNQLPKIDTTKKAFNVPTQTIKSSVHEKSQKPDTRTSKEPEINFSQDVDHASLRRMSSTENKAPFQDKAFNAFVAEFSATNLNVGSVNKSDREETLVAEVEKLKEQLKVANAEKAEITSKYEKLSAICRSQRQELQQVKQALAAKTPSPTSPAISSTPAVNNTRWEAFPDEHQPQKPLSAEDAFKWTRNGDQNMQSAQPVTDFGTWGLGKDDFSAARAGNPQMPRPSEGIKSKSTSDPAGWAVF